MSDMDYNIQIDTPENLMLEAQVAGFGSRCMAALIDYFILFLLLLAFNYLFRPVIENTSGIDESVIIAILILLNFTLLTFYHLFFEFIWNGQTPGKRWLRLRVVQSNGMPATTTGLVIRNLVRIFDFFPFFYGIGLLVMFISKRSQRFGDMAARTVVIYEHSQITLRSLKESVNIRYRYVSPQAELPAYIDPRALTPNDRQSLLNFLQRRDQIENASPVARMLVDKLAARMQVTDNTLLSSATAADTFLEQIARAMEREQSSGI